MEKVFKPLTLIVVTLAVVGSLVNQDPAPAVAASDINIISMARLHQVKGQETLASKSFKREKAVRTSRSLPVGTVRITLGTPINNKLYAKIYIKNQHNWGKSQFECLSSLWTRESGWRHKAKNSSSGAYGIPQSLPADKMASAGKDWKTNPATQIKWGAKYIKSRYGTPCDAYAHSKSHNWY